jgi:hypothetical protein
MTPLRRRIIMFINITDVCIECDYNSLDHDPQTCNDCHVSYDSEISPVFPVNARPKSDIVFYVNMMYDTETSITHEIALEYADH